MRVLYISLFVIIVDQLSKFYIKGIHIPFLNFKHEGMQLGERINVIGDFFRITFIENPGLAFGIDIDSTIKLWITIFSLVASIGLVIYLYIVRTESLGFRVSLALILGGAVGNFIDRTFYGVIYGYAPLFYGKVVDFLDFEFFNLTLFGRNYDRFAIFNIADSAVTIGIILLLILHRSHPKKEHEKVDRDSEAKTRDEISSDTQNELNNTESSQSQSTNDKNNSGKETAL